MKFLFILGLFEGDITLDATSKELITTHYISTEDVGKAIARGSAANDAVPLWKMYPSGDNYEVPYEFDRSLGK